jgi:hypothetical protein
MILESHLWKLNNKTYNLRKLSWKINMKSILNESENKKERKINTKNKILISNIKSSSNKLSSLTIKFKMILIQPMSMHFYLTAIKHRIILLWNKHMLNRS